jgi:hypothetical protein
MPQHLYIVSGLWWLLVRCRCSNLVGLGTCKVLHILGAAVTECLACVPAVLALDDLDLVAGSQVGRQGSRELHSSQHLSFTSPLLRHLELTIRGLDLNLLSPFLPLKG